MKMRFYYNLLYRIVWPFFCLVHPIRSIGRENIPEGGAVFCANHSALADPLMVCFAATLRWHIRPMAKIELSRVPLVGWLLGKAGVIYVDRGHADVKAVKEALTCLKAGGKMLVFPEGTRVHDGEDVSAKGGAALFATRTGVPIVPGCDLLKSPEEATAEAERIGCPVLIKARAGGGGRGIRKVERVEDAAKAFIEARAEGEAVFGDGECYMEKFVAPAHHVEVQIMADKQGHVFSLGERECSVQRRNQKLIEESPAPCLDGHDDIRARMHKAARDLARAVGYEGAGTIEFLYSDDGNFYFMEMNTRLQVEHPVTEFVTDTDLVKWQRRVAAGQPLPFEQEDVPVRNHAMECRINAETPDFLPSCGTVTALRVPGGPRVRWDSAMFTGATVPPYYDSMLGKLIVCAPTRDGAIRKMRSALGELVIEGVSENSELQLDVLANDEFLSGMYHTDLMGHLYADE